MTEITTAARRITRVLNKKAHQGGFCVFGRDGTGGCWYSERSAPTLAPDEIKFGLYGRRVTAAEIQRKLDGDDLVWDEDAGSWI